MMFRSLLVLFAFVVGTACWAREVVNVGGYDFGPYVEFDRQGRPSGLALDFINALNRHQDRFDFRFVATSPSRRYKDFEEGKFDVILFESTDWGWAARGLPIDASDVYLHGGDVYITHAVSGRGQEFFDNFAGKRIVGILGYHPAFAGYTSDPEVLTKKFNMTLVSDNASCIEMTAKGRADIGLVTDAYLFRYLKQNPEAASKLLIAARYDQHYDLRALLRKGARVDVGTMNHLLADMKADHTLDQLWSAYGISQ